jgi:hypothetical protein
MTRKTIPAGKEAASAVDDEDGDPGGGNVEDEGDYSQHRQLEPVDTTSG